VTRGREVAALLTGKKILITGGTGQVARPVAESLASGNEVWCLGRFADPGVAAELAGLGIHTWHWDMAAVSAGGLAGLPADFTHVLHAAVHRGDGTDFDATVEINSVATARLMTHCRHAAAFLFVSSGAVYTSGPPGHRYRETDPLGGNTPWLPTYPVGKIAAEGTARALAVTLPLPTVIARLNVAYGPHGHGGLPILLLRRMLAGQAVQVPLAGQAWCNPIHTDDIARQVPLLWSRAAAPARVLNWGGDQVVTVRELMTHLASITGLPATFTPDELARETHAFDNSLRRRLIGDCQIGWREGLASTVQAHFPGLATPALGLATRPRASPPQPRASPPQPRASTPAPGLATPAPGLATPAPGHATPAPGLATPASSLTTPTPGRQQPGSSWKDA
jgi:UDP-glucuronate 4-epimerase